MGLDIITLLKKALKASTLPRNVTKTLKCNLVESTFFLFLTLDCQILGYTDLNVLFEVGCKLFYQSLRVSELILCEMTKLSAI